jgi:hypothetical protein
VRLSVADGSSELAGLSWTTADSAVAVVTPDGLVRGTGPGATEVAAVANDTDGGVRRWTARSP